MIAKAAACAHCRAALDEAAQVLDAATTRSSCRLISAGGPPGSSATSAAARAAAGRPGAGPGRYGRGLAVRRRHPGAGARPAPATRRASVYRRLTRRVPGAPVRAADQRGRLGRHVPAGQAAFDDEAAAILARLRRARVVCSDETTVRVDGRTCWDWVFRNEQVVIHVIRPSRGRAVVAEVLAGTGRTSGCPTSTAPSAATPTCGRSAWRTSCATCATPSRPATPSSPRA